MGKGHQHGRAERQERPPRTPWARTLPAAGAWSECRRRLGPAALHGAPGRSAAPSQSSRAGGQRWRVTTAERTATPRPQRSLMGPAHRGHGGSGWRLCTGSLAQARLATSTGAPERLPSRGTARHPAAAWLMGPLASGQRRALGRADTHSGRGFALLPPAGRGDTTPREEVTPREGQAGGAGHGLAISGTHGQEALGRWQAGDGPPRLSDGTAGVTDRGCVLT